MPPQHLLCAGLLGSLLVREANADGEAEDGSLGDERAAVDDEDSSDDEAAAVAEAQNAPVSTEAVGDAAAADERYLEKLLAEPMEWAKLL